MDVGWSEEQTLLRESARDFLRRECPMSRVRALLDDPRGLDEPLWKAVAELGWCGLAVPEAYGGAGLGLVDLALVLEEMGRVLFPGPFVSTAVVGAAAIAAGGTPAQRERWLPGIASGEVRLALAQLETTASWGAEAIALAAERRGEGFVLRGVKRFVADGPSATTWLVAARCERSPEAPEHGVLLALVDANAPGVSLRPVPSNERTRKSAEIVFDGVGVAADRVLGEAGRGWPILSAALDRGRAAHAAELAGCAAEVLDRSVAYVGTREQFGQPIGRFQAIQHRAADMLIGVEGIRSAAWYAAWALDQSEPAAAAPLGTDPGTAARLAKSYAGDTALAVTGAAIQLHGGLGFTWEQDLHLFYKHVQATALLYGSPRELRALAADALIGRLTPAAGRAPAAR